MDGEYLSKNNSAQGAEYNEECCSGAVSTTSLRRSSVTADLRYIVTLGSIHSKS
jgi:hypothetical protein